MEETCSVRSGFGFVWVKGQCVKAGPEKKRTTWSELVPKWKWTVGRYLFLHQPIEEAANVVGASPKMEADSIFIPC